MSDADETKEKIKMIREELKTRRKELGKMIKQSRTTKKFSLQECAQGIGTTPKRLASIERGEVHIGAVELDKLRELLQHPITRPMQRRRSTDDIQPVRLSVRPGQTLNILVTSVASPLPEHPPTKRDREDSGRK